MEATNFLFVSLGVLTLVGAVSLVWVTFETAHMWWKYRR